MPWFYHEEWGAGCVCASGAVHRGTATEPEALLTTASLAKLVAAHQHTRSLLGESDTQISLMRSALEQLRQDTAKVSNAIPTVDETKAIAQTTLAASVADADTALGQTLAALARRLAEVETNVSLASAAITTNAETMDTNFATLVGLINDLRPSACGAGTARASNGSCAACGPNTFSYGGAEAEEPCQPCAACQSGTHEVHACSPVHNRICAPLMCPPDNRMVANPDAVAGGSVCEPCGQDTWAPAGQASACTACDTCSPEKYVLRPCGSGAQTLCALCTPCLAGYFQQTGCSPSGNTVCIKLRECGSNEFESQAPTLTSDRQCRTLRNCTGTQYQSKAPTLTTDRECAGCDSCGVHGELRACNPTTNTVCYPPNGQATSGFYCINGHAQVGTERWALVRHVPKGGTWHPTNDNLRGTSAYGTAHAGPTHSAAWSVTWNTYPWFTGPRRFLFATANLNSWLVATKDTVGLPGANALYNVVKSSRTASAHQVRWYNRGNSNPEDPWISLNNHGGSSGMLYGEDSYPAHAELLAAADGGINVFLEAPELCTF